MNGKVNARSSVDLVLRKDYFWVQYQSSDRPNSEGAPEFERRKLGIHHNGIMMRKSEEFTSFHTTMENGTNSAELVKNGVAHVISWDEPHALAQVRWRARQSPFYLINSNNSKYDLYQKIKADKKKKTIDTKELILCNSNCNGHGNKVSLIFDRKKGFKSPTKSAFYKIKWVVRLLIKITL